MSSYEIARRRVHIATIIGVLALIAEIARFIISDVLQGIPWDEDLGGFFFAYVMMSVIGIVTILFVGWTLAYPTILAVSRTIRVLFARRVAERDWDESTNDALWVLPYVAALGAITWSVFSIFKFGGWPSDVIFGSVAHAIAAWFYLSLFFAWFKLWKKSAV